MGVPRYHPARDPSKPPQPGSDLRPGVRQRSNSRLQQENERPSCKSGVVKAVSQEAGSISYGGELKRCVTRVFLSG